MKTQKNILIAFILNLSFSIFEFLGGLFTGSVAIASDAVHDLGDAASIGLAYFLEKKSQKKPDKKYTYGYTRYSVLGGFITTVILLVGSVAVIYNAVCRILNPTEINYNGMIVFAVLGVLINLVAAFFTREGDSINQRAVNLHMLEDVLGWLVVLVGAVVMRLTHFSLLDPIMSIAVAGFIFINALKNLKEVLNLFLEKTPETIDIKELEKHILEIEGVEDVHHIHLWSMDAENLLATMHIVTDSNPCKIKEKIREELREYGVFHVTIETEKSLENCKNRECEVSSHSHSLHTHHHH